MFGIGKKGSFKEGDYVFAVIGSSDSPQIVVGVVEVPGESRIKLAGLYIKPTGLLEKIRSGRGGSRSMEVLRTPHPDNVIQILLDKVDSGDFHDYVDISNSAVKIGPKRYTEIDTWLRQGFPELLSVILSPSDQRREEARRVFMERMNNMQDPELKQTVYAVARQLKIL
ncbi:MAG: hypothetical protein ACE5KA_05455 [Nitrososphaerales archaeon]